MATEYLSLDQIQQEIDKLSEEEDRHRKEWREILYRHSRVDSTIRTLLYRRGCGDLIADLARIKDKLSVQADAAWQAERNTAPKRIQLLRLKAQEMTIEQIKARMVEINQLAEKQRAAARDGLYDSRLDQEFVILQDTLHPRSPLITSRNVVFPTPVPITATAAESF